MSDSQPAPPSFVFGYWRPWTETANIFESYLEYTKDVSLIKYGADTAGGYIAQASKEHVRAVSALIDKVGGGLANVSQQLSGISNELAFLNRNVQMLCEQQQLANLLLHDIADLLCIPDSEKERQHAIEMGVKFLVNAQHDPDLFSDALEFLLKAEAMMKQDYFVLHRIGCIYMYSPRHVNPEKALDYFLRAAKYASVESNPTAARLASVLATRANAVNADVAGPSITISLLAAQSYENAAFAAYVLARFGDAVAHQSKAASLSATAENHFLLSKYQVRNSETEAGVRCLDKAIDESPVLVHAVFQEIDLLNEVSVLRLVEKKNDVVDIGIRTVQEQCSQAASQLTFSENRTVASQLAAECEKFLRHPYDRKVTDLTDARDRLKALQEVGRREVTLTTAVKSAKLDGAVSVEEAWAVRQAVESYLAVKPDSNKLESLMTLVRQCRKITEPALICNSFGMHFTHIPESKEVAAAYYIGVHQVTNRHWTQVMGTTPRSGRLLVSAPSILGVGPPETRHELSQIVPTVGVDDERPVENISWSEAVQFCKKLSEQPAERRAGRTYRLPSAIEWEYACRAGTTGDFWFGNERGEQGFMWCKHNSERKGRAVTHTSMPGTWFEKEVTAHEIYIETMPVGLTKPNPWGLYDMHGNVWEWCADKLPRGGSCVENVFGCRSSSYRDFNAAKGHDFVGFRLVLSLSAPSQ